MIRNAQKAGVRIAFGSDAGVGLHGKTNPEQLVWLVAGLHTRSSAAERDRERRAAPRRRGRLLEAACSPT